MRTDPYCQRPASIPSRLEIIAKAFDDAWDQVKDDDEADPAGLPLVRTALAKRMIESPSGAI